MDELFKAGCYDESQNPLNSMISSLIAPNHAEHPFGHAEEDFHDVWEESEAQVNEELESHWQPHAEVDHEALWNEIGQKEQFDDIWKEGENDQQGDIDDFLQSWNKQESEYRFDEENKYLGIDNLYELAKDKEKQGSTDEAILMLEAEVQKNPEHSEAWCLLGRLHAKNDEDTRAIAAMLKGLEVDPYNLELLMYLGISCTNEFDRDQALMYLKTWIQHHPMYSEIPVDHSQNLREDILEAFKVAVSINSSDPDLYQAIGVLSYLNGDFSDAEDNFRNALAMNPTDAANWNRLGAALAKQEKIKEAFDCYHKALEIRPDFVRTWGNLGLAYGNIRDYENCARFYLCALSLNPKASHLYNYLTTAFVMMNRADLLEKLSLRNPRLFVTDFDIITRETLPRGSVWAEEISNEL